MDCQSGPDDSIIIQVIGWLSNNGTTSRKFCQTFCLAKEDKTGKLFSIRNDIFRYLKDPETDDQPEPVAAPRAVVAAPVPVATRQPTEPEKIAVMPEAPVVSAPVALEVHTPVAVAAPVVEEEEEEPSPLSDATPANQATLTYAQRASKAGANKHVFAGSAKTKNHPAPTQTGRAVAVAAAPVPVDTAPVAVAAAARVEPPRRNGQPSASLCIRNIPMEAQFNDVVEYFSAFGTVRRDSVMLQAQRNASREVKPTVSFKFTYLEFMDASSAAACLAHLEPHLLLGNTISVVERIFKPIGSARGRGGRGRGGRGRGGGGSGVRDGPSDGPGRREARPE